jgi:membrane protease subunit HflC
MRTVLAIFLALIGLAVLAALSSMFTVSQTQQALVLRWGAPVAVYNEWGEEEEPGLKFKIPFVENVVHLDRRNLSLQVQLDDPIVALDQQRLLVDAFARWRISDPLEFYQRLNNPETASQQLAAICAAAIRRVLGTVNSPQIISGQRAELMQRIQEEMSRTVTEGRLGVEIIDVKILRVELPIANRAQVFQRMARERNQEAQLIRSEGTEQALIITADADRQVRVLEAEATEQAQRIRGEGDAQRAEIYAAAYEKDPEFFSFYRTMLAYEEAINSGTTMLLAPNSDFFRYFGDEGGRAVEGE